MKFKFVNGENNKNYVCILDINTLKDAQLMDIIKKALYREEYNRFVNYYKSKTISYSYLFNNIVFPYQFWGDIKHQCECVEGVLIEKDDIKLIDDPYETGVFKTIYRNDFDNWLQTINPPETISLDNENYKYQQDSVFNALNNPTSRIEIATAGGKTFITYMYCRYIVEHLNELNLNSDNKILIVVPSQLLCIQLKSNFEEYDVNNTTSKIIVETIYSNSKKVANANIICGTYQSLSKYDKDYFDDFSVLICDELHRSKAYSIRNGIYCKLENLKYIFGMTGTFPEYNSLDYLHIVSMFGDNVMKIKTKDLIEKQVANKLYVYRLKLRYFDNQNITSDIGEVQQFKKNIEDVIDISQLDEKDLLYGQKRYMLEKNYFQHNISRMELISKILKKYIENSIIFVDTIEYCNTLYEYLTQNNPETHFDIIYGSVKNRDEIIQNFENKKQNNVIIATYGTMSTGVSIKSLTNAYLVDSGKSQIKIKQTIGRIMRLMQGKHDSIVFDFCDELQKSSFKKHSLLRLKIYKNEGLPIKEYNINIHV